MVLLAFAASAASVAAQSLVTQPGDACCVRCDCADEAQCLRCVVCRWTTAGCVPDSAYEMYECCRDCSCGSPGECIGCGCCVDWSTMKCYEPPCEETTSSSTVTTTTERRRVTTTYTTTTHFRFITAGDLVTTTTSTTATTTTTSVTSTTRTSTTSTTTTTIHKPTCSDGIQNQGEDWIDCGGPCRPCPTPDVELDVESPPEVERGEPFRMTVRLRPNQSGSYRLDLRLPEGFESRSRTSRDFVASAGVDVVFEFEVDATDYLKVGGYAFSAEVRDNRNLLAAEDGGNLTVRQPTVIETPLFRVKLPDMDDVRKVVGETREMLFRLVNNTTQVLYSFRWLWAALMLALLGVLYIYYAWRRRP